MTATRKPWHDHIQFEERSSLPWWAMIIIMFAVLAGGLWLAMILGV